MFVGFLPNFKPSFQTSDFYTSLKIAAYFELTLLRSRIGLVSKWQNMFHPFGKMHFLESPSPLHDPHWMSLECIQHDQRQYSSHFFDIYGFSLIRAFFIFCWSFKMVFCTFLTNCRVDGVYVGACCIGAELKW